MRAGPRLPFLPQDNPDGYIPRFSGLGIKLWSDAFDARVKDAKRKLSQGWDRRELLAMHGRIVVEVAEGKL